MNMKIRVRIGFLYLLNQNIQFILIVLVWNIFLKKLINLLIIILKVIYLEYKHTIQLCADTNLFSPKNFKKNDRVIKRIFKNE